MVNTSNFSKRLQKILDFYGVTATSFSEKIAFNRSTISHLLSGRNKPSLEFVMKVLQTYPEVDLYWLLYGKGSFPTPLNKVNTQIKATSKQNTVPGVEAENSVFENMALKNSNTSAIERIILCYKDGTFKQYNNC
ncbi:helix-turn-helix domain-containing protein [Flavobacteriaceae bacterium]|nr:helix-turn-helix domain-containing protein [Flavobacteriaceae bacterium]MDB9800846.1 helix-turn-helix domain-containing protein [Flavobacteriaceae bacterium]MDC1373257.1 helix-turn-helix domain-containing protein [Flavobacteriaceae bacterium]